MLGRVNVSLILTIVLCVCAWHAAVVFWAIPPYMLPPPRDVWNVYGSDFELLSAQTAVTMGQWLVGLVVSMILGFGIAVACFRWRPVKVLFGPLLIASQSTPYLAFAPLLMIWFGLGMLPKIILVVLSCAFPIALAFEEGLQKGLAEFQVIVSMLKLRWLAAFRHVYFPAALPYFFTGLKISASYAFVSTVMAELIGSERGLGIYLSRAQSSYRADRVVAAVGIIVVISLLTTRVVDLARRRVIFWQIGE